MKYEKNCWYIYIYEVMSTDKKKMIDKHVDENLFNELLI